MALQFEAMGLEPAGDDGTYFQSVPLRSIELDRERTTLSLWRGGKEQVLIFGRDFISLVDPGRTLSAQFRSSEIFRVQGRNELCRDF
jgi:hypothetical protein